MKNRRAYFFIFLSVVCLSIPLKTNAQLKPAKQWFLPHSTEVSLYSNFNWNFEESFGENGRNLANQLDLRGRIYWSNNLFINAVHQISLNTGEGAKNIWRSFHLTFRKNFETENFPLFKYGIDTQIKSGWIEWQPRFNNVQFIFENVDAFINPYRFWGTSLFTSVALTADKTLTIRFRGHTGDIVGDKVEPVIDDFYLRYSKTFDNKLGIETQVGHALGSKHVVNYAYFTYQPKWEKVDFTFKLGKLPTLDETPYGVHIGIFGNFKYLGLGGFYERRLNQKKGEKIAGIYWRINGPPILANIFSTFSLSYSFNTNALFAYVPIVQADIKHRE